MQLTNYCQFLTFHEPIQATLSDKYTRISARISVSATREYRKQFKRPFTKDKTGGLIQILDFEIVATHLGPRSDRLTLLVNRFRNLGSDGSGALSVPRPIESPDKGCFALLDKLMGIRAQEKANCSQSPSTRESSAAASSIHSQMCLAANNNEVDLDSQALFATQVPVALEIQSNYEQNGEGYRPSNQRTADPAKALNCSTNHSAESQVPVLRAAQSPVPGTKPSNPTADLLRALKEKVQPKPIATTKAAGIDITTKVISTDSTTSKESHQTLKHTNSQIPESSTQNPVKKISDDALPVAQQPAMAPPSGNIYARAQVRASDFDVPSNVLGSSDAPQGTSNKRKLNDRITSREVRISKDQDMLLNRADSWLPAEPGQREPRANVPIAILQALNHDADSRVKELRNPQAEASYPETTARFGNVCTAQVTDSESEIASEQWPPSPDRDQLPPDSSPIAVDPLKSRSRESRSPGSPILESTIATLQAADAAEILQYDQNGKERGMQNDHNDTAHAAAGKALSFVSSLDTSVRPVGEEPFGNQTQQVCANADGSHPPSRGAVHFHDRPESEHPPVSEVQCSERISSNASTPDTDIEMTVPVPLHRSSNPQSDVAARENFPCTATQIKHPFTQVKRTPYVDGHTHEASKNPLTNAGRPLSTEDTDLPHSTFDEVSARDFSISSVFSKAQTQLRPRNAIKNSDICSNETSPRTCATENGSTSESSFISARMGNLDRKQFKYKAVDSCPVQDSVRRKNLFSNCVAPASITLEQGAQVMLVKTIDDALKCGSLGSVIAFKDEETFAQYDQSQVSVQNLPSDANQKWPVVRFEMADGSLRDLLCQLERWDIRPRNGVTKASRLQIPLILRSGSNSLNKDKAKAGDKVLGDCDSGSALNDPFPGKRILQCHEDSTDGSPVSKRAKTEPSFFYSNLSRRRRRSSKPPALDVAQQIDSSPDPTVSARQYRKEYFAAKRSTKSYAASEIPSPPSKDYLISELDTVRTCKEACSAIAITTAMDDFTESKDRVTSNTPAAGASKAASPYNADYPDRLAQKSRPEIAVKYGANDMLPDQNASHKSRSVEPAKAFIAHVTSAFKPQAVQGRQADTSTSATGKVVDSLLSAPSPSLNQKDAIPCQSHSHARVDASPSLRFTGGGKGRRLSLPQSAFDGFKGAYSDYKGDIKHFLTLCKKIEKLWRSDRLHKSMWDDFLIRNKTEYADYVRQCTEDMDDDPMPYEKFYNDEIDEPKYCKKFLTPFNLEAIIYGGGPKPVLSCETSLASTPLPTSFDSILPNGISNAVSTLQSATKSAITIDLTNDDPEVMDTRSKGVDEQPKAQFPSKRRIPWLVDGEGAKSASLEGVRHSYKSQHQLSPRRSQKSHSMNFGVKDKEYNSSAASKMPSEAPLQKPNTKVSPGKEHQAGEPSWWQDEDTPFKTFVRSYLAIRPGNGNAFAKPEDIIQRRKRKSKIRKLGDLDILNWNLDPSQPA